MPAVGHWSAHQLAEFLSAVSGHRDRASAIRSGVERAGEALEAEVAAFLAGPDVVAAVGFPTGGTPDAALLAASEAGGELELEGLGQCSVGVAAVGGDGDEHLFVARVGDEGFSREEDQLLRGMAHVLSLTLGTLDVLERELRVRRRSRKIIETAHEAFISMDSDGLVTDWNRAAEATFGWPRDEALGRPLGELIVPLSHRAAHDEGLSRFLATGEQQVLDRRLELTAVHRDGREFPIEITITAMAHESSWAFNAFLRDISDRKETEARLRQRAAEQAAVAGLGRVALEGADVSKLMKEAVTAVAETLEVGHVELLELLPGGEEFHVRAGPGEGERIPLGERPHAEASVLAEKGLVVEDRATETRFEPARMDLVSGATVVVYGHERPFGVLGVHSKDKRRFADDELNFLQSVANVLAEAIERRAREEETRHRALHDPLTGLPNRTLFLDRLGHALARAKRSDLRVAVLFLDVDNFKAVNDTSTHRTGDKLLKRLAARLRDVVRPSDTLARFGGDEFVLLCEELDGEDAAVAIAERIGAVARKPFRIDGSEQFVSASIGIALAREGATSSEDLIRDADAAMYRAKERGRDRFELFDSRLRRRALARRRTERELRGAIDRDELRLFYQPIVDVTGGRLRGYEALLRWEHPERGLVAPGDFIPVAEDTGLIVPIGRWTVGEACRQAAHWREAGLAPDDLRYSVNLSARQLADTELAPIVRRAVEESAIPPGCLSLEITESVLMADPDAAVETLEELKAAGVSLVLDDFGTGYSSLSYVQGLPIDALKIDRSFVAGLDQGQPDPAIVSAVISMARALRLGVVAEGVETVEQLEELRALGCDQAQGFYFARPLPPEAVARSLEDAEAAPRARLRAV